MTAPTVINITARVGHHPRPGDLFNPVTLMGWTAWLVWWACKWMLVGAAMATVFLVNFVVGLVSGFRARARHERQQEALRRAGVLMHTFDMYGNHPGVPIPDKADPTWPQRPVRAGVKDLVNWSTMSVTFRGDDYFSYPPGEEGDRWERPGRPMLYRRHGIWSAHPPESGMSYVSQRYT